MIKYVNGNILDDTADALVNPVNCVGVCGKGLAEEFKHKFPSNFKQYRYLCNNKIIKPGSIHTNVENYKGKFIFVINFATKDHWDNPSKVEWIKSGLEDTEDIIHICEIKSIAIPAIGCGLGGLRWEDVKPLIIATAEKLPDVEFRVYEPK